MATIKLLPTHGKVETTSVPAPGVAEVAEPNVIVPSDASVGVLAPAHMTVSVIVIVPVGAAAAVQLTPAVNVTGDSTTGFGVASTFTTLVTWADAGGAMIARMSKRINIATLLPPLVRKFLYAPTITSRYPAWGVNCRGYSEARATGTASGKNASKVIELFILDLLKLLHFGRQWF